METRADAEALKLSGGVGGSKSQENGGEGDVDMNEEDDIEDEEEEEEGRVFSVGEFVWGKIKHHPWWPGQIYDPSHASELALKHKPKDKDLYLVAFFGDGTFSWCSGAQLKSFEENFESLSKQTSLKSFVYAVEDALGVIGELIALEMTCSCVERDDRVGNVRPVAENAGVRKGVLVPMVGVESLAVARIDAAAVVASVRNAARSISVKDGVELTMLKSKLLAFYRSKRFSELPKYHFPEYIVGLEDINMNKIDPEDGLDSNEDSQSPLASSLDKAQALQEDKLYGRRKQKSLADIIREETDTDRQNAKDDEGTPKKRQGTRRKKRTAQTESGEIGSGESSLLKGKKRAKSSQKINSNKDIKVQSVVNAAETYSVDDNDKPCNVEEDVAVSSERKRRIVATSDEKEGTGAKSMGKKRNKDSPSPMASLKHVGFEPVVLNLRTDTRVGERMSKAAKLIIESPPIKKQCDNIDPMRRERLPVKNLTTVGPLHERPLGSNSGVLSSSKSSNYDVGEDDDGKPMSAIIFLSFPDGVSLPSKADLITKYSQFGLLDEEETDVLPNSLDAQVVFIKKSEGECAFDEMVKMNAGDSEVQYRIRYIPRVSKVRDQDGAAPPKTSPQSNDVNSNIHPVSLSYLRQKFETVISKLNDTEGETLSMELKTELQSELSDLLEKLARDG